MVENCTTWKSIFVFDTDFLLFHKKKKIFSFILYNFKLSLTLCTGYNKWNTGIFCIFPPQLPPLRSKSRLENKDPAVISSQFWHLILQNLQDRSKFLSIQSYNGTASMCNGTGGVQKIYFYFYMQSSRVEQCMMQ